MNTIIWRPVIAFLLLAFGLVWLLAAPLWAAGTLSHPWFLPIALCTMLIPSIAAVIVTRIFAPGRSTFAELGMKRPAARELVLGGLFGIWFSIAIWCVALAIGSWAGYFRFDFEHMSGLHQLLAGKVPADHWMLTLSRSPVLLTGVFILGMHVAAPLNALAALGEEAGWRGWLLPRLLPLGLLPALLVSGVIWALWHAPLILLGYNYAGAPGWLALLCMTGLCIPMGAVLAWLRLRSGSVWTAALSHGAFNAGAGVMLMFGTANQHIDTTVATPLGWTGWIFPALLAVFLFRSFPPHGPTAKF